MHLYYRPSIVACPTDVDVLFETQKKSQKTKPYLIGDKESYEAFIISTTNIKKFYNLFIPIVPQHKVVCAASTLCQSLHVSF